MYDGKYQSNMYTIFFAFMIIIFELSIFPDYYENQITNTKNAKRKTKKQQKAT